MTIEQLKRNDIQVKTDLDYFVNYLKDSFKGPEYILHPAVLSSHLTEAFFAENKHFSVQLWFLILLDLSKESNQFRASQTVSFVASKIVQGKLKIIKSIFKYFYKENIVLPHFKDGNNLSRLLINQLPDYIKTIIFAIDNFVADNLGDVNYQSMIKLFVTETKKVKIMTTAYAQYLKEN